MKTLTEFGYSGVVLAEMLALFALGAVCWITGRFNGVVVISVVVLVLTATLIFIVNNADDEEDFPRHVEKNRLDDDEPIAVINYDDEDHCPTYAPEDYKRQDDENFPGGGCAIF